MTINYAPTDPVAGASRATAPTEVTRWTDYADTIADVDTRITTVENATSNSVVYEAIPGGGTSGPNITSLATSNPSFRVAAWHFDAAGYEALYLLVPTEKFNGWTTLDVEALVGNSGTGTGDVLWDISYGWVTPTTTLAVVETSSADITWTATDRDVLEWVTLEAGIVVSANKDLRLQVRRRGGEAGDTLANDAGVVRVRLGKAS